MLNRKEISSDLCVIGGGMAGLCAAIAAARAGISVVLMHERSVLGGNASSEIRMWICGASGHDNRETGIIEEIALENYYRNPTKNYYIWDTVLYDFVTREKNITMLLNCTCMDASVRCGDMGDGRTKEITSVTGYQMTTQTFFTIKSKYYADCSGDSILAPLTGAEFRIGRESADEFGEDTERKTSDSLTMGMSCLLQGRETDRPVKYTAPNFSRKLTDKDFEYRNPDIYNNFENFWYLELGGDRDAIRDTEKVASELIPLATGTWDYIKNSGNYRSENWDLDFIGFLPGKRESRRMVGEYTITEKDISGNRVFEDTVAYGGWPLDDHPPLGFHYNGEPNTAIDTPSPYCIPYRALYAKSVSNLFFAGRNISTTHMALSSTRVMATCALLGQAVGTAAAVASRHSLTPHGVYKHKIQELQDLLLENDCFLPNTKREISDLCKSTPVINGSDLLKDGEDRPNVIYGSTECGQSVSNGTRLTYKFDKPEHVNSLHITFDSDLNRSTLPGDYPERAHSMRCNVKLDSPQCHMPKTLCRKFTVLLDTPSGEKTLFGTDCNLRRAYDIDINESVCGITLIPQENWGGTDETRVFSYDFR